MKVVEIRKFDVFHGIFDDAKDRLLECLSDVSKIIDNDEFTIRIGSSSELFFLSSDEAQFLFYSIHLLFPKAKVKINSQACLSLHAGILDFEDSFEDLTLLVMWEYPQARQQLFLDAALNQNASDPKRLLVSGGWGVVLLEKKSIERLEEDALAVGVAKIYSETSGIRKSFSFVKKMREDFGSFAKSIQFVSFEVCSSWSKEMKRCFLMFCEDFFAKSWLDSVENDQRHYLSLKPLMELSLYHKQALKNPLAFLTLGAGGRFGVLMIGSKDHLGKISFLRSSKASVISLSGSLKKIEEIDNRFSRSDISESDYRSLLSDEILYLRQEYRGKDNLYFEWSF